MRRPGFVDLTGSKIDFITVLEHVGTRKSGTAIWRCRCVCGNEFIRRGDSLKYKHNKNSSIKSCGCKNPGTTTHGKARTVEYRMFVQARHRAKQRGIPFNIELEDISIPKTCPVFGVKLETNTLSHRITDCSPTLDRIDPKLGYIKGNIKVISSRANRLKSDMTGYELAKILEYVINNSPSFSLEKDGGSV